jgi:hypothetical protein
MLENLILNSIDQYIYIFGAIILAIFSLYKAFDIYYFHSSENRRYKDYLNDIIFKSEEKIIDNDRLNMQEGNTYEDIFG